MFKNFLKVAIRNIFRQKIYALINILGLAIGLACSLLIMVFIMHELSYDMFHSKKDQIYRLCIKGKIGETEMDMAYTAVPTAPAFKQEFPEITEAIRLENRNDVLFRYGEKSFVEDDLLWADSTFFKIFDFRLISGQPDRVLTEPQTIVLTEKMANKYFGDEEAVGKSINMGSDSTEYRITGIVENPPENSHLGFNFIASFHSLEKAKNTIWLSHNLSTYFLLGEDVNANLLEEKIQPVMLKYVGPEVEQFLGVPIDQFMEAGNAYGMYLQPLSDIHLNPEIQQSMKPPHERKYIYIFSLIAAFILIIACINFMNLSTARSANRSREVGMRKVLGSTKNLLVGQFLMESIFLSLIALILGIVLLELLLPAFSNLIHLDLRVDYFANPIIIPSLIILVIFVGILSGSYPAFYLSSFRPLAVLSGKLATGMKTGWLRSILVVLQFTISVGIVIATIVVTRQVNYLLNKDLGYETEQMVNIQRAGALGQEHIQTFKQEIANIPGVITSTNSTMLMGNPNNSNSYSIEGQPFENSFILNTNWIDFDYAETFELEVVQGRFLSPDYASDSTNVVVNEAAVRAFNMEDPLSIRIIQPSRNPEDRIFHQIVGVVRDFHFASLHTPIEPFVLIHKATDWDWGGYLTVRLETENLQRTISEIENTWKEFTSNQPMEYSLLDDDLAARYEEEKRTGTIFGIFSVLAILVACLGLLGLSSYSAEQRTREIGLRKVMGATVSNIVRLLSKETLILILIATIISVPVAWITMGNWLESFAFRIKMGPFIFIMAFLGALAIALLTVSIQAMNAALKNPAESLRYE
ncbi:MAG: ABC transporter permease [Bacteroidales bacterium]|nr:ABC transporter permease [Bacteroidales bacterium]